MNSDKALDEIIKSLIIIKDRIEAGQFNLDKSYRTQAEIILSSISEIKKMESELKAYKKVHKEWENKFREGFYLTEAEYIEYVKLRGYKSE